MRMIKITAHDRDDLIEVHNRDDLIREVQDWDDLEKSYMRFIEFIKRTEATAILQLTRTRFVLCFCFVSLELRDVVINSW